MIYTLTLNPAIDCYVWMEALVTGAVNRDAVQELRVGGKGVNVSNALRTLGVDSVVLGFVAGGVGRLIEDELARLGLRTDLNRLDAGQSRINIKIQADAETAVNARGPAPDGHDFQALLEKMDAVLAKGDTAVLSGGVPAGLPDTAYADIVRRFRDRVRFVVDAERSLLRETLPHRPFLIKPNAEELGDLFGVDVGSEDDVTLYGGKLLRAGAENVLVSRGGDGAVLLCGDGAVFAGRAPERVAYSTVGAGDAMVAGFLAGLEAGDGMRGAFALGLAVSAAQVYAKNSFSPADVRDLLPAVRIHERATS